MSSPAPYLMSALLFPSSSLPVNASSGQQRNSSPLASDRARPAVKSLTEASRLRTEVSLAVPRPTALQLLLAVPFPFTAIIISMRSPYTKANGRIMIYLNHDDEEAQQRVGITPEERVESDALEDHPWQPKMHSHSPPSTRRSKPSGDKANIRGRQCSHG